MADDTALKERLHNATHAPDRAPGVAPILRRARTLRLRKVAAAVTVTCLLAVAVAIPLRALRHLGQATTPAAGTRVSAFGISANVPPGWSARIYAVPGYGGAALYDSTAGRLPDGPPLSAWNAGRRGGLAVGVVEVTGLCPCPGFPAADSIAAFAAGDWYQPSDGSTPVSYRVFQTNGGYLRPITIDGRSFLAWATLPSRDAARPWQFQRIGTLLDSVRIAPEADQPDASTLPVRFDGSSGSTGASTNASGGTAWASSTAFATDDLIQAGLSGQLAPWPNLTLQSLGPDDVVVVAWTRRGNAYGIMAPSSNDPLSLRLADARKTLPFEGEPRAPLRLAGLDGGVPAVVNVYFGSRQPPSATRALTRSLLHRLHITW